MIEAIAVPWPKLSFSAWLPKVSLAYAVSDNVNAGVLLQRAFNPGGTSVSLTKRAEDRFEAERLTNLEGFVRAGFGQGRGTLSANVFANWIENAQRQLSIPVNVPGGGVLFTTDFINAPKAFSHGLETEIGWRAGPDLSAHRKLRRNLEGALLGANCGALTCLGNATSG